jgi:amino acid permease
MKADEGGEARGGRYKQMQQRLDGKQVSVIGARSIFVVCTGGYWSYRSLTSLPRHCPTALTRHAQHTHRKLALCVVLLIFIIVIVPCPPSSS